MGILGFKKAGYKTFIFIHRCSKTNKEYKVTIAILWWYAYVFPSLIFCSDLYVNKNHHWSGGTACLAYERCWL
jgi:hypothetical protein